MEVLLKLVEGVQLNRGGGLDTGCLRSLVHQKLVTEEAFLERRATTVCCVHGDTVLSHLAKVHMEVEGKANRS